MKLARALFLGKTELKLVASLGKIGYLLPEAARSAFFNKVLKKEFDELEGDNPRLDPEPWRQWTRAPGGIDREALARLPKVAETWAGWRAQSLKEAWGEAELPARASRPRF